MKPNIKTWEKLNYKKFFTLLLICCIAITIILSSVIAILVAKLKKETEWKYIYGWVIPYQETAYLAYQPYELYNIKPPVSISLSLIENGGIESLFRYKYNNDLALVDMLIEATHKVDALWDTYIPSPCNGWLAARDYLYLGKLPNYSNYTTEEYEEGFQVYFRDFSNFTPQGYSLSRMIFDKPIGLGDYLGDWEEYKKNLAAQEAGEVEQEDLEKDFEIEPNE